jgi:hypothetical protein
VLLVGVVGMVLLVGIGSGGKRGNVRVVVARRCRPHPHAGRSKQCIRRRRSRSDEALVNDDLHSIESEPLDCTLN